VQPLPRDADRLKPGDERRGHRDDRITAPKRAQLEALVHAILPASSRKTVDGGNGRNAKLAGDASTLYVGSIAVGVDQIRPSKLEQRP
jgi:hypothetical protein